MKNLDMVFERSAHSTTDMLLIKVNPPKCIVHQAQFPFVSKYLCYVSVPIEVLEGKKNFYIYETFQSGATYIDSHSQLVDAVKQFIKDAYKLEIAFK